MMDNTLPSPYEEELDIGCPTDRQEIEVGTAICKGGEWRVRVKFNDREERSGTVSRIMSNNFLVEKESDKRIMINHSSAYTVSGELFLFGDEINPKSDDFDDPVVVVKNQETS